MLPIIRRRSASFQSIRSDVSIKNKKSIKYGLSNRASASNKVKKSVCGSAKSEAALRKSVRQKVTDANNKHNEYKRHKEKLQSIWPHLSFVLFFTIDLSFYFFMINSSSLIHDPMEIVILFLVIMSILLLWTSLIVTRRSSKKLRVTSITIHTLRNRSNIKIFQTILQTVQVLWLSLTLCVLIIWYTYTSKHESLSLNNSSTIPILQSCVLIMLPISYQIITNTSDMRIIFVLCAISTITLFLTIFIFEIYSYSSFCILIASGFIGILCYEISRQSEGTFRYHINELIVLEEILLNKFQEEDEKTKTNELRRMIGSVAHDVKSPLSSLRLGLDNLLSLLVKKEYSLSIQHSVSEEIEICKTLESTFSFMSMTIGRAMDFQRTAKGLPLVPDLEYIFVEPIINRVVECCRNSKANVPVRVAPLPRLLMNTKLHTDESWLFDNLLCLVSNAVKYTDNDVVRVRFQIVPSTVPVPSAEDDKREMLLVEVEDCGPGLSANSKVSIFSLFNDDQRKVGGAGLGLYCLSRRARALGGSCGVRDREPDVQHAGAVFWMLIPYTTYRKRTVTGSFVSNANSNGVGSVRSNGSHTHSIKSITYSNVHSKSRKIPVGPGQLSVIQSEKKISYHFNVFGVKSTKVPKVKDLLNFKGSRKVGSTKSKPISGTSVKKMIANISGKIARGIFSNSVAAEDNSRSLSVNIDRTVNSQGFIMDPSMNNICDVESGYRVLILGEDDDLIAKLKSVGHHIDWAESGMEAYEILLKSSFDVVIISSCIHYNDTILFLQKFRYTEKSLVRLSHRQLIVVVNEFESDELREITSSGADYVLNVPFALAELDMAMQIFASLDLHGESHEVCTGEHINSICKSVRVNDASDSNTEAQDVGFNNSVISVSNSSVFGVETPPQSIRRRRLHNMSILVVDDSMTILKTLAGTLKNAHFDVTKAENGQLALDILRSRRFDAVLLDQQVIILHFQTFVVIPIVPISSYYCCLDACDGWS